MASYEQPKYVDQRVRFFNNQFLVDQDMIDEQKYHIDRQRRLAKHLYTPGIVEGLEVSLSDAPGKVIVKPGTAINSAGQQIVLADETTVSIADFPSALNTSPQTEILLVISYDEQAANQAAAGTPQNSRWHEKPVLEFVVDRNGVGTTKLPLAQYSIEKDNNRNVKATPANADVRVYAGMRLRGALSVSEVVNGLIVSNGKTELKDGLTVANRSLFSGSVTIGEGAAAAPLTVNGVTTLNKSLTVNNELTTLNKGLSVNGELTTLNKGLSVNGELTTLNKGLTVSGRLTTLNQGLVVADGDVGIGTTAPSEKLEIKRTGKDGEQTNYLSLYNDGGGATQESRIVWKNGPAKQYAAAIASQPGSAYNSGDLRFQTAVGGTLINHMIINSGGNVGIGTVMPAKRLDVQGGSLRVSGNLGTTGYDPDSGLPSGWKGGIHTHDIYAEATVAAGYNGNVNASINRDGNASFAGNVGIGTTTPSEKLEIKRTGKDGEQTNYLSLYNDGGGATQESRIVWKNGPAKQYAAAIASQPGSAYNSGDLRFQTAANGTLVNHMIINSAGNVGIGTVSPKGKLHVNGEYSVFTKAANDHDALTRLDTCDPSTLILGGPWSNAIYFYWKDERGNEYTAILQAGTHRPH